MLNKQAKILILADIGSPHTYRWATSLVKKGYEVSVVGLNQTGEDWYQDTQVKTFHLGVPRTLTQKYQEILKIIYYLATVPRLNNILTLIKPDLLHAHYASSYGLLGALCHYHPFVLSVWGTDIFNFPLKSWLHKEILKYNFRCADAIASTSKAMADDIIHYTKKSVFITPFGVDTKLFSPRIPTKNSQPEEVTIGIVKTLEPNYGIHTLIEAFSILAPCYPQIRLLIVGSGSQLPCLQQKVDEAGLSNRVEFVQAVHHSEVPKYIHRMDIFVVPSKAESFGVAALEASSCGLPVIASRVGGLPEVVMDGKTGILIPPENSPLLAKTLQQLIESPSMRSQMGQNGRKFVEQNFSWDRSLAIMEEIYSKFL